MGVIVALLASLFAAPPAASNAPTHAGKIVLFGNLHAHTKLSDDVPRTVLRNRPVQAYAYANEHGLDFLGLSDHHKAPDSNHRLFLTEHEYKTELFDVAMAFNADHVGDFVAIPGIEWGNTRTGNHLNVFGAPTLPPETILDAGYDDLYAWATAHAAFVQLNHPHSWRRSSNRNRNVGNFGQALYPSAADWVSVVDGTVKTVSIITTVHGGHLSGKLRHSQKKTHRAMQWESYYKALLNQGLHVSPAANQDTHWRNFGTVTAARTAVWADAFDYPGLMAGITANRIYATEDDELVVAFSVRYQGKDHWMGQTVELATDEADVQLQVRVWQAPGIDGDATEEGPYTVALVSDPDGVGGNEASVWNTWVDIPSATIFTAPVPVVAGEYFYLVVTEQGGSDNLLGDGEDERDNETGAHTRDGKRDDPNDSAWTSPVWFSTAEAAGSFVWSKRSGIYHDPWCWAVDRIGAANRREGPAPAGKRKHDCPPQQ